MAYVAVSGGKEAIEESIKLLEFYKSGTDKDIETEAIENKLSLLVDRVMSEAGLYSKAYAALALKQCEGSVEEAVFFQERLLRELNAALTGQQRQLDAMERILEELLAQVEELRLTMEAGNAPANTAPPHYQER